MQAQIRQLLINWNTATNDRQKLQHTYIVLLIMLTLLAGIVALFSGERSRQLMYLCLALVVTLVTNVIVWSLLKTNIVDKLPAAKPIRSRAPKR